MIIPVEKYKKIIPSVNQEMMDLEGELSDRDAKALLGRFLRANLGFGLELLSRKKIRLAPFQEILLKGFLTRNFSLLVASRGASKSYLAGIVCFLICLFEPGAKCLIIGPTFRTARNIFNELEKILSSKEAILLLDCFSDKVKRNDAFSVNIGTSNITAIPMNFEKLRGYRANVLILDEYFLLTEDVIKKVLIPFLIVPMDVGKKMEEVEEQEEKIQRGEIRLEDIEDFPASARMICLTSASYTFEYAYKTYVEWIDNILSPKKTSATYFVAQIGWKAIPRYLIDKSIIELASAGGEDDPTFQRECNAIFTDGSASFFSAKKMFDQTIKDGESPTVRLKGDSTKRYVLSCDPSWSSSPSSDNFTFAIGELADDGESFTLIHSYAKAGGELKDHIRYFYYILTSFNIVLIIPDMADGNFIKSANESALFQKNNIQIDFIEYDGSLQGEDYVKMLKEVRTQYNLTARKICFKQLFNQESIRRMNEQLQTCINTKKVWFASRLTNHSSYDDSCTTEINYDLSEKEKMTDFISNQDDLIYMTKKEASLIEIRTSPTGGMIFDLPANLKRNNTPTRARRDSYSALLLLCEGVKAYNDIMRQAPSTHIKTFRPIMVGKSSMSHRFSG